MKRAERLVAIAFVVAIVAALALFVVYVRGGNPQAEGALLFLALGGIGVGMTVWATRLMPRSATRPIPAATTNPRASRRWMPPSTTWDRASKRSGVGASSRGCSPEQRGRSGSLR